MKRRDNERKLTDMLKNLPPAEPPAGFDERFWSKFEARRRSGTRGLAAPARAAIALCCLAAALLAAAAYGVKDRPAAQIVHGDVALSSDGLSGELKTSRPLKPGDEIETGTGEWAVVELSGKYRVKIHPSTRIRFETLKPSLLPGKTVLRLAQGEVLVSIGGHEGIKYPFEVLTPTAFAKALGTQFAVRAGTPGASVQVLRGAVQAGPLTGGSASTAVNAGRELFVDGQAASPADSAIGTERLSELEDLFQFGEKDQALLMIGMGPERIDQLLKPCAIYLRYESGGEAASRMAGAAQKIRQIAERGDRSAHAGAAREVESAARLQQGSNRVPTLLFSAAYHAYAGSKADAARVFEEIAAGFPRSSFRSLALLGAARMRLETGDAGRAAQIAREILEKHPRSPEAEPASGIVQPSEAI